MHAAETIAGGDSVLSPDAILWSPNMTRSAFYRNHWEGRGASSWVYFPAQDRLDAGLSTHADRLRLDAATIRAVVAGMDVETARAHVKTAQLSGPASCTEGGHACVERAASRNDTLVFDGGEYLLPAVHSLVDSWKRYWNVYVGANFYLTPPGTQAFGYHSDHTDVFVLQLEGMKQWSVCDRVLPNLNDRASFGKVPLYLFLSLSLSFSLWTTERLSARSATSSRTTTSRRSRPCSARFSRAASPSRCAVAIHCTYRRE